MRLLERPAIRAQLHGHCESDNMQVGIFDPASSTDGSFTMQTFQCQYNKRAAVADGSGGRLTETAALVPCWRCSNHLW